MHTASPLTFFLGEPARPPSRGVRVPATTPHGRERMWASSLRLCIPVCPFFWGPHAAGPQLPRQVSTWGLGGLIAGAPMSENRSMWKH